MFAYAGIGSRRTPPEVCDKMTKIAQILMPYDFWLRSGGAKGADTAFEKGAPFRKQIFRPHHATPESMEVARGVHEAWHHCDDTAKKLHGRNAMIILGEDLQHPVDFVLCWTDSPERGGTRIGMKIAFNNKIPVFNLQEPQAWEQFKTFFKGYELGISWTGLD